MADSTSPHDPEQPDKKRNVKYDAILIQLSSQRPSNIFRGMEQVRQWLKENPENQEVYGLLLDAVQENRELLRDKVRNLLTEMMEDGKSKAAEAALSNLPGGIQDLLADADDEYYAAEYEKAILSYRRVLKLDPENARAKEHLAKAEIKLVAGETSVGLPRSAVQYYRRARSYLAARDITTAVNLLNAAVEAAQIRGQDYPDAAHALSDIENLIKADEFRREANQRFEEGNLKDAFSLYERAINLDSKNEQIKKESESLQNLWFAENELQGSKVLRIFSSLTKWQNVVNTARLFVSSNNAKLRFVEKQIQGIQRIRFIFITLFIVSVIAGLFLTGIINESRNIFVTETPAIPTLAVAPTNTVAIIIIATETIEPTLAITSTSIETPTITPTETPTLTPTQATLGTGYIIKAFVSSWEVPNEKFIEGLGLYQPVTVLEKQEVAGSTWYRCSWINKEGQPREGWILGEYITFGIPPTPRG